MQDFKPKSEYTLLKDASAGEYPVPPPEYFENEDAGVLVDFIADSKLEEWAKAIIVKYPEFSHLYAANILILWKKKGATSHDRLTFGTCQKPSSMLRHFAQCDFIITLSANHCRSRQFTYYQIEALIYHELSHIGYDIDDDGKHKLFLQGHEFEGFPGEIQHYGSWRSNAARMEKAFQGELFA
jgi:hypothetical protein